jgi:hypothetical protein
VRHRGGVRFPLLRLFGGSLLLALSAARPAAAAPSPVATCQAQLQRLSNRGGAEEALRACVPLFAEPSCQSAWTEFLDSPSASPGYGRGPGVARLAAACVKAYCRVPAVSRQPLCASPAPPPLTAEFFSTWRAFQTEVLRREHVAPATSDRLVQALQQWTGFSARPGARTVLQVVSRPDVPGVVGLTLWSAKGDRLGAWVTDVLPDDATLVALQAAVPVPSGAPTTAVPCIRLEASGLLSSRTVEVLLKTVRAVCPAEVVTVTDV